MFSSKTSRWFGLLFLVMLGLRIGYKYYRTQHKPDYQAQMQEMQAKQDDLVRRIQAQQDSARAAGFRPVRAGDEAPAADTARSGGQ